MRRALIGFAILLPVLVLAQPGGGNTDPEIDVEVLAPPDTPYVSVAPPKVSGTCVEISCLATKSCVPWVLVGGTVKIESDYIPAPFTPGSDIAGFLRIDSTHWQHGTNLHISMLATYHNPQTGANRVVSSPIRTTQVWNQAKIFGHPSLSVSSHNAAINASMNAKYEADYQSIEMADVDFLNWTYESQLVHLDTHGRVTTSSGPGGFLTNVHNRGNDEDCVEEDEIEAKFSTRNPLIPPANLFLGLWCPLENPDADLLASYGPWATAALEPVSLGVRDRVFVCFRGSTYSIPESNYPQYTEGWTDVSNAFANEFYGKLLDGYQAWVARDNAAVASLPFFEQHYPELEVPVYDIGTGANWENYFDFLRKNWPCLGDNCMTLKGVYNDGLSIDPSTTWKVWGTP